MEQQTLENLVEDEKLILNSYEDSYVSTKNICDIEFDLEQLDLLDKIDEIIENKETSIKKDTLLEIVAAILSGKHIILYGPPGTGKTYIAKKLPELFNSDFTLETANSDWSTYHTVGGLKVESKNGKENFVPKNGSITNAIIKCCNYIGKDYNKEEPEFTANWLIIDELNRADMDKAFGQLFTALDFDNPEINLNFYNTKEKKKLYLPKRFRIIGTMNNYDKDFLFHVSYALSRRFAYIYIGVPQNNEGKEIELHAIKNQVITEVNNKMGNSFDSENFEEDYKKIFEKLKDIIYLIRNYKEDSESIKRDIGFAQFKDTLKYIVLAKESVGADIDLKVLLDMAIASNIVPQLEGLNNKKLKNMIDKIDSDFVKTINTLENYIENSY